MEEEDSDIFSGTVHAFIGSVTAGLGVALGGVDVMGQDLVSRRELKRRIKHRELLGHERYLNFDIQNITHRKLPSGSSAIDVSMVITGDYRPPPYVDLDVIAEDSINRNGEKVVSTLRERGERAGRDFFDRVEAIEAVREEQKTDRPTRSPINSPTVSPEGPPTQFPSGAPTYGPTSKSICCLYFEFITYLFTHAWTHNIICIPMCNNITAYPSAPPSRPVDVGLTTGSREDLALGGHITYSYGGIFNIRTKPNSGVVILTGFDFYTHSTADVTFELWTRLGSFKEHRGTYDGWDLIASGTTKGRGIGQHRRVG